MLVQYPYRVGLPYPRYFQHRRPRPVRHATPQPLGLGLASCRGRKVPGAAPRGICRPRITHNTHTTCTTHNTRTTHMPPAHLAPRGICRPRTLRSAASDSLDSASRRSAAPRLRASSRADASAASAASRAAAAAPLAWRARGADAGAVEGGLNVLLMTWGRGFDAQARSARSLRESHRNQQAEALLAAYLSDCVVGIQRRLRWR